MVNALAIIGLLIAYLAPYIDPRDFWPIAFFGLSFKVWVAVNLFLMVFWIVFKKNRWAYNAFFLLLGIQFIGRNIQFNKETMEQGDLRVCSFNTTVQQVYAGANTSMQIDRYLKNQNMDVAVLIEWLDTKGDISKREFPHQQFVHLDARRNANKYGLRLVSKHKIINWEKIKYTHKTNNLAAYFDVDVDGAIIRFVAVHLQSNAISSKDYHTLVNVELDDEYTEYAKNFVNHLRQKILLRSEQTQEVLSAIENSPYPVVILGDFNDTPQSYTYQQLLAGRKDAFVESGHGWGATFLKPFPLLRIDYILHDEELECISYTCNSKIVSDHALVEAHFNINE